MRSELDRLLLRALLRQWKSENAAMFHERLLTPVFTLSEDATLGRWSSRGRILSIDRPFAQTAPWGQITEVLRHEMAHQFVDEILGVRDETAHGRAFRSLCERHGIDGRAQGRPRGDDADEAPVVRRVRKLLALANSPEPHEAAAAMAAAKRLLAEHPAADLTDKPFTTRWVGDTWRRRPAWARLLGGLLTAHFQVDGIWIQAFHRASGDWGSQLELSGTPQDVDIALYVWDYVIGHAERAFDRIVPRPRGQGARDRYVSGVVSGLNTRLDEAARTQKQTALVHVPGAALKAYVQTRHPHSRHQTLRIRHDEAYQQGVQTGRDLHIHPGVAQRGAPRGALPGT